jgi:subtilase family serine protease
VEKRFHETWRDNGRVKRSFSRKLFAVLIVFLFAVGFTPQFQTVNPGSPDDNWVAHPMHTSPLGGYSTRGYSPSQIRTAYNLPSSGGDGTTIAIVGAYDSPNILNDYNTFCAEFGLPDNSTGNFFVHKMDTTMTTNENWTLEACLDVEWAHAIAPNAKILLVEAVSRSNSDLIDAIDYATSQPGVVAVSMSWGGDEFRNEVYSFYENHFVATGIAFFAASGDSGAGVMWPACSPNVVAVGGTTLILDSDGNVISETGWSGSGGGVSAYEPKPNYQNTYGTPYSNRAVPDVSYNAGAGVAVYCEGLWYPIGGTSAGAPQWAANHALGLSATNPNFYVDAKSSAYSSYFRDITEGSNGYSANDGYDLVTGLGSPLTTDFTVPPPIPTPTPTPTVTPTPSPTPTASPTATPSPTPSATPTATPTPTPSATPTATPTPAPLPTPNLSFYCVSSTTSTEFYVQIKGSLTYNGAALSGAGIQLSYSVTDGASWQDLAYVNTGSDGSFSCSWIPSASGIYVIKAVWAGNSQYSTATAVYNFAVQPFNNPNQNIFSVTSNSTLTSLGFDSANDKLSFTVTGESGTMGLTEVCIPQSLIPDISKLTVMIDDEAVDYTFNANGNVWIITFTYNHSSHNIVMELGAAPTPTPTSPPATYPPASSNSNPTTTNTPQPAATSSPEPSPTPEIPESSLVMMLVLLALATSTVLLLLARSHRYYNKHVVRINQLSNK